MVLVGPDELIAKERLNKVKRSEEREAAFAKLTDKQKKFVEIALSNPGMGEDEVARRAGYSLTNHSRSTHIVSQIQGRIGHILKMNFGVTEYDLAKLLKEGMVACHQKIVYEKHYDKEGNLTKEVPVVIPIPDWAVRIRVAALLMKHGYPTTQKWEGELKHKMEQSGFFDKYAQVVGDQKVLPATFEEVDDGVQ